MTTCLMKFAFGKRNVAIRYNFVLWLSYMNVIMKLWQGSHASWKILESPVIFIGKFAGPGKSRKMTLVLESPGNLPAKQVLEFARNGLF